MPHEQHTSASPPVSRGSLGSRTTLPEEPIERRCGCLQASGRVVTSEERSTPPESATSRSRMAALATTAEQLMNMCPTRDAARTLNCRVDMMAVHTHTYRPRAALSPLFTRTFYLSFYTQCSLILTSSSARRMYLYRSAVFRSFSMFYSTCIDVVSPKVVKREYLSGMGHS